MSNSVQTLFATVHADNPDVTAVILVDGAGRASASVGDERRLVAASTALMVPLREMLERCTAELGAGDFASCIIQGSDSSLAVADVDGERTVAVVGAPHAAPGSLLADARWLAAAMRQQEAA
jgi:hypothetical protein